jgi:hypothetical protein
MGLEDGVASGHRQTLAWDIRIAHYQPNTREHQQQIQLAKRRARGSRNINNFINMIYFLCGKLLFFYPRFFT